MKKFLFRAKTLSDGSWVYGYPVVDDADCSLKKVGKCSCPHDGTEAIMYVWVDELHEYDWVEVDGRTVEQVSAGPVMERAWAMPNRNTFEVPPIAGLLQEEVRAGLWIDPFANRNKYAHITNDLNPEFDTDYHMDALEFLKMFENASVDGVLYDPPYSPRQVSECCRGFGMELTGETTRASFWGNQKKEIARIVKPGGKVITFGWNSGGIGRKHGFEIRRILLVAHGGWHNDTICTVEAKVE